MVHYIYKITCLCGSLAGHYYIGKHTTKSEDIYYYGSGVIISNYYKKYGKKNGVTFIKEILEYNETAEINKQREKEIIGDLYETDPMCLNLTQGGGGGLPKGHKKSLGMRKKLSESRKGIQYSEETKKRISDGHKGLKLNLTEEGRKKKSQLMKERIPWNRGKKFEDYTPDQKKRSAHTLFKKGQVAHNKGVPMSEEQKKKISETLKNRNKKKVVV